MKQYKFFIFLSLLSIFFSHLGYSSSVIPVNAIPDVSRFLKQVSEAGSTRNQRCDAIPNETQDELPCLTLAETICKKLWNDENQGFLETEQGTLQVGKSNRSELSYAQKLDLEAWVASEPRLPEDLQEQLSPILNDLGKMLNRENRSLVWYQKLSQILQQLKETVTLSGNLRVQKLFPELKQISKTQPTVEEQGKYQAVILDFNNEILRAKYENHPNWKRVDKVFKEVKKDLIATIQELNLPEALRKTLKSKVDSVNLTLPYSDPRLISTPGSCGTTEKNALYSPVFNLFTVCAGLFNTLQSESNLYFVIAHELSHSIDPESIVFDEYKKSTLGQAVIKLRYSSKSPFSCHEWKQLREKTFTIKEEVLEPLHPYSRLNDCLTPLSESLRPFNSENLHPITRRQSAAIINKYANSNSFSLLTQRQININRSKT